MSFPRYPKYKDSGAEWLGQVPEHWQVKRLKRACHVFPSNVDKKSHEGEMPVLLCNYTDVYYNDTITAGMDFMAATASSDQIAKFTLCAGDTIITKDSETADDIAVGAYVPADLPGVVCGYHLSMVRPLPETDGAFVKKLFDSTFAKSCFEVRANGLTRVGLGQYELDNVELPFPPRAEQTRIAEFLDRETGKIDALVAEQKRLMTLLKEKRQAVISHAVTKGLNPQAPLKPSGIEWLGDMPEHWNLKPVKHLGSIISGFAFSSSDFTPSGIRVLKIANIQTFRIDWSDDSYLPHEFYEQHPKFAVKNGDVVFALTRPIISTGLKAAVADIGGDLVLLNQRNALFRPNEGSDKRYIYQALFSSSFLVAFENKIDFTGQQPNISPIDIGNIKIPIPPYTEQTAIAEYLESVATNFDALTGEAQRAIDLLQERRTALISAAVTGQIDVRPGAPVSQPA